MKLLLVEEVACRAGGRGQKDERSVVNKQQDPNSRRGEAAGPHLIWPRGLNATCPTAHLGSVGWTLTPAHQVHLPTSPPACQDACQSPWNSTSLGLHPSNPLPSRLSAVRRPPVHTTEFTCPWRDTCWLWRPSLAGAPSLAHAPAPCPDCAHPWASLQCWACGRSRCRRTRHP